MKILLTTFILLLPAIGFSQVVVDVGKTTTAGAPSNLFYAVGGVAMNNAKYVAIVEGSAFFNEALLNGKIILSGGKIYADINLRLDLMDNTVHYMSPEGEELIATSPIKSIILIDPVSKKENKFDHSDFIGTGSKVEKGWYEMLDTGTVRLYKRHNKSIRENKPYGSATVEQYITTTYSYYMLINSIFTPVKKIKSLPDMLQDKKTELLAYINSNNLTGKSDKDYMALVSYYNILVSKR
jgi:hypothetical protein